MLTQMINSDSSQPQLLGIDMCLEILFPDKKGRPSIRTFRGWQAKGFIPYHKVGSRVFFDPSQVRKALDKQFLIQAK